MLNDDTEFRMPCIDKLVETIEKLPKKVAIVSPKGIHFAKQRKILCKAKKY